MLEPAGPSSCKMMQPDHNMILTDSGVRHHPVAFMPPPLISTGSSTGSGSKRRKDYVDPCSIAPLKKRRIQVSF